MRNVFNLKQFLINSYRKHGRLQRGMKLPNFSRFFGCDDDRNYFDHSRQVTVELFPGQVFNGKFDITVIG